MSYKFKTLFIASGGTGGHIFPAYGLAKHFIQYGVNVYLTSDKRGLKFLKEFDSVKKIEIASSSIYSKNFIKSLASLFVIFYSILKSVYFVFRKKPNLVFGMGGYSSFPVCIAAKLLNIPIVIYENNLYMGKTNKYLAFFAKKILVPYKELEGVPHKYQNKICEIGNIVRKEILDFEINKKNEINGILTILVLGGSQAAKVFAEKLPKIFQNCKEKGINLKIFQQCLASQNQDLSDFYQKAEIECEIFNFSNDLSKYFLNTDLVITRAGSSMLAELINVKLPFISIPLPSSADNHQLKNAIYYEKKGYSYLIEEKFLNEKLFDLINKINQDKSLLDQIIVKQKEYSDKSVYENILNEINKIFYEKY